MTDSPARTRDLYERFADEAYSFLMAFLQGDRELARDALQEAFLRIQQRIESTPPTASERGWVLRIARNAAVDLLRARKKEAPLLDDVAGTADVAAEVAHGEAVADARRALAGLPQEDRALLLARHGLGLKLTELAELQACTERTVRNRLRRAGERLAQGITLARSEREEA